MKSKPTKYAVALVIYNEDKSKYLIVKRPDDDDSLPGHWGFPALTKKSGMSWEDTVFEAARNKLGVEIDIVKMIGEEKSDRGDYYLILRDYEVKVTSGVPKVPQKDTTNTQYVEYIFTDEVEELKKSARSGSLCSAIFLRSRGVEF